MPLTELTALFAYQIFSRFQRYHFEKRGKLGPSEWKRSVTEPYDCHFAANPPD